jgi:hypothetical protein
MRNNDIAERDRCHRGLVRQVLESQTAQHRVELRVLHSLALKHQYAGTIENFPRKEWLQRCSLQRGQRDSVRRIFLALCRNVPGDEFRNFSDLVRAEFWGWHYPSPISMNSHYWLAAPVQ